MSGFDGMISVVGALFFTFVFINIILPQQEIVPVNNVVTNKYTDIKAVLFSGSRTAYYLEINHSNVSEVDIEEFNRYQVNDTIIQYVPVNHPSLLMQFCNWISGEESS